MSVDDKRSHSRRAEMVEGEGDQRFSKNRDERFWQLLGERPKPCPEPGAKHKSLCDHLPDECRALMPRRLHRAIRPGCQLFRQAKSAPVSGNVKNFYLPDAGGPVHTLDHSGVFALGESNEKRGFARISWCQAGG